jgi:hypothetical protein
MKRWHEDIGLMRRRARASGPPLGRMRKRHPGDCGRSHCHLCSGRDLYVGIDRARAKRLWRRDAELA